MNADEKKMMKRQANHIYDEDMSKIYWKLQEQMDKDLESQVKTSMF